MDQFEYLWVNLKLISDYWVTHRLIWVTFVEIIIIIVITIIIIIILMIIITAIIIINGQFK